MPLSEHDRNTIVKLSHVADAAKVAWDDATSIRDDAILIALTEQGAMPGELSTLTGLTRQRIYQIKERGAHS